MGGQMDCKRTRELGHQNLRESSTADWMKAYPQTSAAKLSFPPHETAGKGKNV